MMDFVSNQWIRVVALAAATSVGCAILIPYGFPWTGLLWVSLAFSAAFWVGMGSPRSIWQVIHDIEAEPVRAVASRVAMPAPRQSFER